MLSFIKKYILLFTFIISLIIPLNIVCADDIDGDINDEIIYTEGYIQYTISDDSITIVCYYGDNESVKIPRMIGGHDVKQIASNSFTNSVAKEIIIPDTISFIDKHAFKDNTTISFYNYNNDPVDKTLPDNVFEGYVDPEEEPDDQNIDNTGNGSNNDNKHNGTKTDGNTGNNTNNNSNPDTKTYSNPETNTNKKSFTQTLKSIFGIKDEKKNDEVKIEDDTTNNNVIINDIKEKSNALENNTINDVQTYNKEVKKSMPINLVIAISGAVILSGIIVGYILYKRKH